MLAGQRDRSRPSGSAHQFRVVLYSRFLLGPREWRHEKNDRQSAQAVAVLRVRDRKSTRLNSSHSQISYAVFCLKKKNISRILRRASAIGGSLSQKTSSWAR